MTTILDFTTKIEVGTRLLIETEDFVYDLSVDDISNVLMCTITGGEYVEEPVILVGSWQSDKTFTKHVISKNSRVEFILLKNSKNTVTSPVKSVHMTGPDNRWEYELWEDNK